YDLTGDGHIRSPLWLCSPMPVLTESRLKVSDIDKERMVPVSIVTRQPRFSARRPSMAPLSSIRLFVVSGVPPCNTRSSSPNRKMQAQPPGPGFPRRLPSTMISTSLMTCPPPFLGPSKSRLASIREGAPYLARICELSSRPVVYIFREVGSAG